MSKNIENNNEISDQGIIVDSHVLKENKVFFKKWKTRNNDFNKKSRTYKQIITSILFIFSLLIFSLFCVFDGKKLIDFENINNLINQGVESIINKYIAFPIAIFFSALGISFAGMGMQVVSRNPLASPTTLGYLPAVITGLAVSRLASGEQVIVPYIIGIVFGCSIILINFVMIKGSATEVGFKPILVGFAIGGMITGINTLIEEYGKDINIRLVGFIDKPVPFLTEHLYVSIALILISSISIIIMAPYYQIMSKDVILAKALGIKVNLVFWMTTVFAVLITVSTIMSFGILSLLGMVAPHMAKIINPKGKMSNNLINSFFISLILLTASNWLARVYTNFSFNFFSALASIPVFIYIFTSKKYRRNVE